MYYKCINLLSTLVHSWVRNKERGQYLSLCAFPKEDCRVGELVKTAQCGLWRTRWSSLNTGAEQEPGLGAEWASPPSHHLPVQSHPTQASPCSLLLVFLSSTPIPRAAPSLRNSPAPNKPPWPTTSWVSVIFLNRKMPKSIFVNQVNL